MQMLSATTKLLWQRYGGTERRVGSGEAARYRPRRLGLETWVQSSLSPCRHPPSPACTSVAPLAKLECSAENYGCEYVSGVSERRLRMKWIHVAGLARPSCKNMPQEMRVFMNPPPMQSKRGEPASGVAWREIAQQTANKLSTFVLVRHFGFSRVEFDCLLRDACLHAAAHSAVCCRRARLFFITTKSCPQSQLSPVKVFNSPGTPRESRGRGSGANSDARRRLLFFLASRERKKE
jgi:hypothetical protein